MPSFTAGGLTSVYFARLTTTCPATATILGPGCPAIQPALLINRIGQGLGLVDETATRLPVLAIKGTLVIACDVDGDGDKDLVFSCNGPSQQASIGLRDSGQGCAPSPGPQLFRGLVAPMRTMQ